MRRNGAQHGLDKDRYFGLARIEEGKVRRWLRHAAALNAIGGTAYTEGPTGSHARCANGRHSHGDHDIRPSARARGDSSADSAERAFNKLSQTFAVQVEALKRYRTGGEQKVTVQHV